MIKILLVEDEYMWQQGITALLSAEPDFSVVGIVDNADDAEIFFDAENPDVVLVDWKIRGSRDGLELASALEKRIPPSQIILVTGSPVDQIPKHPYHYVPKPKIANQLISQIRTCLASKTVSG